MQLDGLATGPVTRETFYEQKACERHHWPASVHLGAEDGRCLNSMPILECVILLAAGDLQGCFGQQITCDEFTHLATAVHICEGTEV